MGVVVDLEKVVSQEVWKNRISSSSLERGVIGLLQERFGRDCFTLRDGILCVQAYHERSCVFTKLPVNYETT